MSIFTFISRRLPILNRRKKVIFPPVQPAGFIPSRVHRHKFISRRPQKFFFLQGRRHIIFPPVQPAGFVARPNRLRRVRPRRAYPRPHRVYPFSTPSVMVLQRVWRIYLHR